MGTPDTSLCACDGKPTPRVPPHAALGLRGGPAPPTGRPRSPARAGPGLRAGGDGPGLPAVYHGAGREGAFDHWDTPRGGRPAGRPAPGRSLGRDEKPGTRGRGYSRGRGLPTWTKHLLAGDNHCPTVRKRGAGRDLRGRTPGPCRLTHKQGPPAGHCEGDFYSVPPQRGEGERGSGRRSDGARAGPGPTARDGSQRALWPHLH